MSKEFKEAIMPFCVLTAVLYAICAFSQLNVDFTQWSTVCRAILGIGEVAIIIYLIFVFAD